MVEEKARVFLSVGVSDESIKEIAKVQDLITKKLKFTGKTTELENLHVTLKFFGEISLEEIEKIDSILKEIKFQEIDAKLSRVGTFSYNNSPKIIWIKLDGDLTKLQRLIDKRLEPLFPLEDKFMSHLTIARVKYVKDVKYALEYINNLKIKNIEFKINSLKLQSSKLTPDGPIYTVLKEYKSQKDN